MIPLLLAAAAALAQSDCIPTDDSLDVLGSRVFPPAGSSVARNPRFLLLDTEEGPETVALEARDAVGSPAEGLDASGELLDEQPESPWVLEPVAALNQGWEYRADLGEDLGLLRVIASQRLERDRPGPLVVDRARPTYVRDLCGDRHLAYELFPLDDEAPLYELGFFTDRNDLTPFARRFTPQLVGHVAMPAIEGPWVVKARAWSVDGEPGPWSVVTGCGCASGPSGLPFAVVLLLPVVARRRR